MSMSFKHHLNSLRGLLIAVPILCCLLLSAPSSFAEEEGRFKAPVHFQSYQDIFGYIITQNGLFNDPEMVLQLSNDCKVDYVTPESSKDGQLAVLIVNLINPDNKVNELRGASGNGEYYVLQFTATGMDLVGVLAGNSWKHQTVNGRDAFVTTWHMSAEEYTEVVYEWNGSIFDRTTSRTVRNAEDH